MLRTPRPRLACPAGRGQKTPPVASRRRSRSSPYLGRRIATPNGTTEAGWAVMERRGVPPAISDAIVAASNRAATLAAEVAKAHG